MSVPVYDESPKYWETYLTECQVNGLKPDISDYGVWLSEQDIDEDENWESNFDDEETQ